MSVSAPLFEYERDAVRVKACYVNSSGKEVHKKFSVDPNLTSHDTLRSLLCRAFDLNDNFRLAYLCSGDFVPLLNDWDLDAAVLCASEPSLRLVLTDESRLLTTDTMDSMGRFESATQQTAAEIHDLEKTISSLLPSQDTIQNLVTSSNRAGASFLRKHYNQTIPVLSKWTKAFSTGNEGVFKPTTPSDKSQPIFQTSPSQDNLSKPPLSDQQFRGFMNNVGELVRARELRLAIYHGGVEPHLRKVVWKHLLGVYPSQLNGRERLDYMKKKSTEYETMKEAWTKLFTQGQVPDKVKVVTNMIRKDVLRTDRHHKFFASEANENINALSNILTTYALNHPSVSYCQGMSDLLSPILVTMIDESHAYLCFCALMTRLRKNFLSDGVAMTQKFQHLSEGLMYYDPEYYAYLKRHQADDLLFCYRWLLLEMKREFAFEDALRVMETLWASLPPSNPEEEGGLCLYEEKFVATVHKLETSAILTPKRQAEMTFSKLVSLRRRTSSTGMSTSPHGRLHRFLSGAGSKDSAARDRPKIRSLGSDDTETDGVAKPPLVKSQSHLVVGKKDSNESSGDGAAKANTKSPKRLITNLRDFTKLAKKSSTEDPSESSIDEDAVVDKDDDEIFTVVRNNQDEDDGSVGYVNGAGPNAMTLSVEKLPEPTEFGDGNPFLMFLCLACLLQHRDHIMREQFDYQEIAMYFDRMVRKHDVEKTLSHARKLFAEYLNDEWASDKPTC